MSRRLVTTVRRSGSTLVEMLVVVAIIGLLAAFAVPAVMRAMRNAQASTIKIEVDMLAQALEDYRTKYGEYPPDGSNWIEFQRHCRKAFNGIVSSEIEYFNPANTALGAGGVDIVNDSLGRVMEPAEALVLFLGGLSDDPQHPFTGTGGPFILNADGDPMTNDIQYNAARQNPLFDFDAGRLTIVSTTVSVSNDEGTFFGTNNDLLPVYLAKYGKALIAYFNSRTYAVPHTGMTIDTDPDPFVTRYASSTFGTAVPYVSDETNTASALVPKPNFFANKASFQLVCAGMDGKFNELGPSVVPLKAAVQKFTSSVATKSSDTSFDNVVNFTDSTNIGTAARAADTAK